MLITPDALNGLPLEKLTATIFVESGMFATLTASNVGLGSCGIKEGGNRYTYDEAIFIIKKIDAAMQNVPKYLRKRIWSTRMSFALAFGPEMIERTTRG